ncbi:hypothetical protein, unlikely [Trypanosoma brucei gambiense DAL972]|uniref:Uncharacterized protein n=1 Tax=Trypanosoma brucei gambiense (strain MHOM/CI/86/DAL972) TaxID=679716 RepID=C9ZQ26_TRYB9|nr:hypothetical protein, unlikely [Trypanosoma brucei gambiense DAL972]CBH11504.1 hypothetical protein, unlikely [Trypanosoma brucei gambiense DAL972]|eukprot:XP_011773791.1 hypothetical protein, unlikely [Trypanosoma brucei gambiense DAL972]
MIIYLTIPFTEYFLITPKIGENAFISEWPDQTSTSLNYLVRKLHILQTLFYMRGRNVLHMRLYFTPAWAVDMHIQPIFTSPVIFIAEKRVYYYYYFEGMGREEKKNHI